VEEKKIEEKEEKMKKKRMNDLNSISE